MAAKAQPLPQDNTGSFVLSQNPPSISLASSVLASVIPLPEHPLIAYSVFASRPPATDPLEHLELARRAVLLRNKDRPFVDSLLPAVYISKDAAALYVFALASAARTCDAHQALSSLEFDALTLTASSSFTPAAIYPCSSACSTQLTPCHRCLDSARLAHQSSSLPLLPRDSLRLPLNLFLQAARDRLIDDVAQASKLHPRGRSVTRLKAGFLLGPIPTTSEWGSGWENYAGCRPLISCSLHIHLSFSAHSPSAARLVIHPVMRPTYYLPLRSFLPLPAGTPIILLPQGVPAYFLSTYNGPAAALTTQFDGALVGFGAGDWKRTTSSQQDGPHYIIAWLAVQNKQGEDKGMPIIWPSTLCVSYHSSSPSTHARSTLPYIPELPSQLQASPPPPAAPVPTTLSFAVAGPSPAADAPASAATSASQAPMPFTDRDKLTSSVHRRPSLLRSSPTSDSLRAFRMLSLAKKPYARDIKKVAGEVGGYVDSVLKERDRERERIKRERQEQEIAIARAKLASANPAPKEEPPAPPAVDPETVPARAEEVTAPVPESAPLPMEIEPPEPESHPTVESDHSGDSLFSPPDAPIDLPSTDEEPPPVVEQPVQDIADGSKENDVAVPPQKTEPDVEPSSIGFDPFNGFDSTWGHTNGYMYPEMDFSMPLDPLGGGRTAGAGADNYDMDDGFGVFTEDDFSFFDAPTSHRAVPVAPTIPSATSFPTGAASINGPPTLGLTPLVALDGPLSGPGPPSANGAQQSPWATQLGEPFTPKAPVDMHSVLDGAGPPELLPPSPTKTPCSHSAPTTPSVHLSESQRLAAFGPRIFDPIPFASSHREADGKYAIGKFALPSPPADDHFEPLTAAPTLLPGWKMKYSAATDPRIGVVRKLIGVKRKSLDQGARPSRKMPLWESYREPEDWQSASSPPPGADSEESDDEPWVEDEEMTSAPRPSTPPPSYLPLGPSLLKTHFVHPHLLPMCTPLRPPGMAVNAVAGNAPPISVPTPVSPAAILGAASEKSKSLEAAAQILVKEVVENPVWQEAWRANASLSATPPVPPAQVWQADARYINQLVGNGSPAGNVDVQTLFGGGSSGTSSSSAVTVSLLDSPLLAVGKGESVIQLSPTSLRFWERLGLSPRSGPKDVVAFVLFEERKDEDREAEIESWLARVSAAYSAKNFGSHVAGSSNVFIKPGLAPVRFDTLRKTICSFVQEITTPHTLLVFYIATPSQIISSSSTTLRQILSAVRRFHKQHSQGDILVHLVPESLIFGTHIHPASSLSGLDVFVCSVYDRLLQPVNRAMSRKLFELGPPVTDYLEAPAYALVPYAGGKRNTTVIPHVSFALESSASSLDVTHRHSFLHVGYQISTCGRWIIAACVDAEGEAHDLKAWLTPDDSVEEFMVAQVWSFVYEFSRRASIEWRVVISKLGLMSHSEINAWASRLDSAMSASMDGPPMHVTLLSIDTENPWTFIAPPDANILDILKRNLSGGSQMPTFKPSSRHTHTTFSDATCATYFISPSLQPMYPTYTAERVAKCPPQSIPGSSESPFIPDTEDEDGPGSSTPCSAAESLRVPAWTTIICAPSSADYTSVSTMHIFQLHFTSSPRSTYGVGAPEDSARAVPVEHMSDIVRNFHELAVLSRARWKLRADPALPFHLAALEVMRAALSGGAVDP